MVDSVYARGNVCLSSVVHPTLEDHVDSSHLASLRFVSSRLWPRGFLNMLCDRHFEDVLVLRSVILQYPCCCVYLHARTRLSVCTVCSIGSQSRTDRTPIPSELFLPLCPSSFFARVFVCFIQLVIFSC